MVDYEYNGSVEPTGYSFRPHRLLKWWIDDPSNPGRVSLNNPHVRQLIAELAPDHDVSDLGRTMTVELLTIMVYIQHQPGLEAHMAAEKGKSFTLRLPPELYEPISAMAERERRSLHGQVLYLLDQVVEDLADIRAVDEAKREDPSGLPLEEALTEIERERAALFKAG